MVEVLIRNREELSSVFAELGAKVGPRRGPNKRTKDDKEWWCLRTYVSAIAIHDGLEYPVAIRKADPPEPDFVLRDVARGTYGIEVTEATTNDWQQELTLTENDTVPRAADDGWAGDAPEREVCDLVWAAICRKQEQRSTYALVQCDLLIYENSRPGFVVDADRLFQKLRLDRRFEVPSHPGFDIVALITAAHVVHDLFGQRRLLSSSSRANHPRAK